MHPERLRCGAHRMTTINRLKIAIAALIINMAGCSTITFDNRVGTDDATDSYEQWHHIWAFDLYEGSKPVNLKTGCSGKEWLSVTTETSFLNGFTEIFTSPVWHPETVTVNCSRNTSVDPSEAL